MTRPKIKNMSLKLPEHEFEALEEYCKQYHRGKTELIREFIRSLPTYKTPTTEESLPDND
ncbi:MAG: CopG family transcriptional regulator [Moorea sp. SIO3I7]|nr:CopG family transcriptional regulator [Moorena sp. SIO3I7]NEO22119.1 CopG family transcriptional regulator [Moorena sp. SIO4A5]NEO43360.1 CopG family transcriptional regulator [Moorena sp. SIO4A3]NEP24312.1 CopG family transcriptional regulator [Moorena sp. SIO3I6]